MQEII